MRSIFPRGICKFYRSERKAKTFFATIVALAAITHSKINKPASYALAWACLLILTGACSATTVVVLITDDAIFVAADSKVSRNKSGIPDYMEPPLQTQKVFAIQGRLLIGASGESSGVFIDQYQRAVVYDDKDVIKEIETSIPADSSISEIVGGGARKLTYTDFQDGKEYMMNLTPDWPRPWRVFELEILNSNAFPEIWQASKHSLEKGQ